MDKLDKEVVEALSEPAKRIFRSLDSNSQKRLLKKARELAGQKDSRDRQKERVVRKKQAGKRETRKKNIEKRSGGISGNRRDAAFSAPGMAQGTKDTMATALHIMLMSGDGNSNPSPQGDRGAQETSASFRTASAVSDRTLGTSARLVSSQIRANLLRQRARKKRRRTAKAAEKNAGRAVRAAQKTGEKLAEALKKIMKSVGKNPVVWIAFAVIILIGALVGSLATLVSAGGAANNSDSFTYQAQVSAKTEGYRELVEKYCEKYDIDDYVDLCLAMIEQESAGSPPDVMQAEQSYYNTKPPIDTPEESIDCGTHELADCLEKAKCRDASDIPGISLAIQGYNFGNGYIDWALKNYKGYTKENAVIFSKMMCAKLGYSSYGDVDYVPHVLRYYVANPETEVSNGTAKNILKELKENNKAPDDVWRVIEKGASLIGRVKYSMDKRQGDGRDNPEYLDCSSFTAWSFHKGGCNGVAYGSTTATFISSAKFVDIEAKDLKPGDIGLKSRTGGTGGANHVGIYCGTLKNGTKVWMHCTSSSGTSLTGNTDGPMFGAYTNFTYFRRLKKWNK